MDGFSKVLIQNIAVIICNNSRDSENVQLRLKELNAIRVQFSLIDIVKWDKMQKEEKARWKL